MKRIAAFFGLLLPLASVAAPRLEYLTYGVMLHWNFSENEFKAFSYGVEAAYWNFGMEKSDGFWSGVQPKLEEGGYGLDVGVELDFKNLRFYAEPEVGWVLAGVSAGPVLEFPRGDGKTRLGAQASGWLSMAAGADFRYRRMDGKNIQAVGLSGKLATMITDRSATMYVE